MKILKSIFLITLLTTNVSVYAQTVVVNIKNLTPSDAAYYMKIGDGVDVNENINSLRSFEINYDVVLNNPEHDFAKFTAVLAQGGSCSGTEIGAASKIINSNITHLNIIIEPYIIGVPSCQQRFSWS